MSNLKTTYQEAVAPALLKARGYKNCMEVPRIEKIVVNMGLSATVEKDALSWAAADLATITGQQPAMTKARVSISNFKLREGMTLGAKVTLRGQRMFEFLERLIQVTLPRIRDFRGISPRGFDGRGNYSLGIAEQTIFPEIDPNRVKRSQGMDITIVTTAKTDDEARDLLTRLGMPFAAN